MEEKILNAMLEELRGLRKDNEGIKSEIQGLRKDNEGVKSEIQGLRDDTNKRFISLENKFEGLKSSVEVLQFGVNQVRQELIGIKEILGNKVIWQNETITFEVKDGTKMYGVIHKGEK
ncbi:MAG: hypothetical protein AB1728_15460 [Bacteroidota bacterium]